MLDQPQAWLTRGRWSALALCEIWGSLGKELLSCWCLNYNCLTPCSEIGTLKCLQIKNSSYEFKIPVLLILKDNGCLHPLFIYGKNSDGKGWNLDPQNIDFLKLVTACRGGNTRPGLPWRLVSCCQERSILWCGEWSRKLRGGGRVIVPTSDGELCPSYEGRTPHIYCRIISGHFQAYWIQKHIVAFS